MNTNERESQPANRPSKTIRVRSRRFTNRNWTRLLAVLCLVGCAPRDPAPTVGRVRIMPLGDSITQGDWRHGSYRRPLWRHLRTAGHAVDFVGSARCGRFGGAACPDFDRDHEGHWGWTLNRILVRLPAWAESAHPEAVLIHLGANDLFQGDDPDTIARELRQVVDTLRTANPRIALFVAQLIPAAGMEAEFARANERIRALAGLATEASPVFIVDHFSGFDPARHTYDGVHPNEPGTRHMADRWFAALAPWLNVRASH